MDLKKIYKDSNGKECNILQIVKNEPEWAANRLQEGERAIKKLLACEIELFEIDRYNKYFSMFSK